MSAKTVRRTENYLLKGAAKSDAARNRFEGTRRTATERSGNKREWA
ncbi:MAG: hypothetical protein IJ901_10455 [Bacteroidaceae bacterium]|nr:hypothetical protein [Bacteroidaceae bacterium]